MKGSGMKELTYQEAADYVEELPLHTKKNPFELNQRFYEWLGEPGSHSKIVHIAGTNGKGSVCAYLNSVLTGAGYCVGMFTSPHLVDIQKEIERLEKEEKRLAGELARVNGMLNNEKFVSKAPESKVAQERAKLEKYTQMMEQVKERLGQLKK